MVLRRLLLVTVAATLLAACSSSTEANRRSSQGAPASRTTAEAGRAGGGAAGGGASGDGRIEVVAAENTWGAIVAGLGGDRVHVTSVVEDPNVDPHDYEATVGNARSVANAQLVVLNGGGYDAWMEHLLTSTGGDRRVVNAAATLPSAAAANVHLFADPGAVQVVSMRITAALSSLDPGHAAYFVERAAQERKAWNGWVGQLRAIARSHGGTMVAATETLALPVLQRAGLRVVTPLAYMRAASQGVDPSPRDVELAGRVVEQRTAKLLASNLQATTPITEQLVASARAAGVPVVAVFEVLPRGSTYYEAMDAEARAMAKALSS